MARRTRRSTVGRARDAVRQVPVCSWAPPRGPRTGDGSWPGPWAARPEHTYVSPVERRAVNALHGVVVALVRERYTRGLSLRALAARTGLALSGLTGMAQGSAWPAPTTLATVAGAVDLVPVYVATRGPAQSR